MADFTFVINPTTDDEPDLIAQEQDIVAFRVYERLSGMDPALDLEKQDLRKRAPEDDSPESPFDIRGMRHAPPVLNKQETVQPPYYLRILLCPPVIARIDELSDLLGRSARLTVMDSLGARRHVRGLILRAMNRTGPFGRSNVVELQVYPTLWATAISEKSRVWRDVDSVSVLRQILGEYRDELGETPAVIDQALNGRPPVRECVIQWNESDFAFVSRLLERDGIYYFFTHKEDQVNLHLADMRTPYSEGFLPHRRLALEATLGPGNELFDDHASFLSQHVQTVPRSYRVADYNPATADTVLDYSTPSEGESALEVYDYPGEFASLGTAPTVAGRRHTAVSARQSLVAGASRCPFLTAGHAVTLPPFNADADEKPFRVVEVVHELIRDDSGKPYYRNWFEALDGDTAYAPTQRTPVPAAHGTHNATVVSALPEETVDVDEYSRALVLFRWDPSFSPVRARLGQPWAGGKHGVNVLARAGDEVLVGFIQGNTERPVILTALHNSNTPKAINPTRVESRDLQDQNEQGPERQNRYATAIHNSTGNALYFNDESDKEIVKLDAYRDFLLEVGHKTDIDIEPPPGDELVSLEIADTGLGYLDSFVLDNIDGKGASARFTVDDEGRVAGYSILNPGSGFDPSSDEGKDASPPSAPPQSQGPIANIDFASSANAPAVEWKFPKSPDASNPVPPPPSLDLVINDSRTENGAAMLSAEFGPPEEDPNDSTCYRRRMIGIQVDNKGAGYQIGQAFQVFHNGTLIGNAAITAVETPRDCDIRIRQIGQVTSRIRGSSADSMSDAMDAGVGTFLSEAMKKKEKRGSALLRTYGDLTFYVGKMTDLKTEYPPGDHTKEKKNGGNALDQGQRGNLKTYVMGGTTTVVRGSFAFTTHPVHDYLVQAQFTSGDYIGDRGIKSSLNRSFSASANYGSSASFACGADYGHSDGFASSFSVSGQYSVAGGASAENKLSFDVTNTNGSLEVASPLGKAGYSIFSDWSYDAETKASNVANSMAIKTFLVVCGSICAALNTVLHVAGAGIKYHAAHFDGSDEDSVKEFLSVDMPKISMSLHILSGITYALNLALGLTFLIWRVASVANDISTGSSKQETPMSRSESQTGANTKVEAAPGGVKTKGTDTSVGASGNQTGQISNQQ